MSTLDSLKQRLLKHARRKDRLPDDQTKALTLVLAALRIAEKSVIETLATGDLAVAAATSVEMNKPEHLPALRAMAMAAIAGATNALNTPDPEPTPSAERHMPDGWPKGWQLGQIAKVGIGSAPGSCGVQYFSARDGQPTALRWDTAEEARRDAWERAWAEESKP